MRGSWQLPEQDVSDQPVDTGLLVSLHFLLTALRRRWRFWVGCTLVGAVLGMAWVTLVPPQSTGTVTLYLAHDPNVEPDVAMATDISLLRTRTVASALTKRLDLDMAPDAFQASVFAVAVTPQVLRIDVKAPGDGAARERAAALAEEFLRFRGAQLRAGSDAIVAGNRDRVQRLEAQTAVLTDEFERLSAEGQGGQSQAAGVLSERSRLTDQITSLQQSSEERTLQTEAVLSASSVVDRAAVVPRSVLKRWVLTVGSMLVGGLVLGVGLVMVTALTSNRLRRRDEIALALGVPVVASTAGRSRSALVAPVRSVVAAIEADAQVRLAVASAGRTRDHEVILAETALALVQEGQAVFLVDLSERGKLATVVGRLWRRRAPELVVPTVLRPQDERGPRRGALRLAASGGPVLPEDDAVRSVYESADVVLALAEIEPTDELAELAAWVDDVVLVVVAGRSSAERLRSVAELVKTAGLGLSFALLTRADRTDESLGLVGGAAPGAAAPARTGDASRDDRDDRPSARRSAR